MTVDPLPLTALELKALADIRRVTLAHAHLMEEQHDQD